jgi:hypothetical protein
MNKKGFLGPIGDDLPSLIPLVFALIVFFGVFNLALGVFERKSSDFSADIAVLQIANGFRGTGYITGYEDFEKTCNSINVRRIKYVAGLIAFDLNLDNPYILPDFTQLTYIEDENTGKEFVCSNTGENQVPQEVIFSPGQTIISRIYPMVLDFKRSPQQGDTIVRPVQLVIVAWK